jgi:hypothetical protein
VGVGCRCWWDVWDVVVVGCRCACVMGGGGGGGDDMLHDVHIVVLG